MTRTLLAVLALALAAPPAARAHGCDRERAAAERRRAECVRVLIRAGIDPSRAAAECAVRHPVRCRDD